MDGFLFSEFEETAKSGEMSATARANKATEGHPTAADFDGNGPLDATTPLPRILRDVFIISIGLCISSRDLDDL